MAMSFLSKDVLCAPVDLYYFLWAPLNSACHNFKASISMDPDSPQKRTQQVAYNNLSFPNQVLSTVTHFFVHLGVGATLSIPVLNILPFSCLVIKAKEFVNPDMKNTLEDLKNENTKLKQEKQKIEDEIIRNSKNSTTTSTSSSTKNTKPIPTPNTPLKTHFKQNSPPSPANYRATSPNPKHVEVKVEPAVTEETASKEGSGSTDHLQRRSSGRVDEMKKRFQNNQDGVLPRRNSSPIMIDKEAREKEKILEDSVVVNYFNLFPENSSVALLRKKQDKSSSIIAEQTIVNNLILNFPGHVKDVKFTNADLNLKALREHLVQTLGVENGNSWIRETYSNDVQVQTKDNPFEIVRKGIFCCSPDEFSRLIMQFDYIYQYDCIVVTKRDLGS